MTCPDSISTNEASGIAQPQLLSEVHGEKLDNLERTLWDIFSKTASEHPDHEAIVSMWQSHVDGLPLVQPTDTGDTSSLDHSAPKYIKWSYRELHHKTTLLSAWLSHHGFQPQDRVAAFLWNSAEWGLFFWACAKLGLVYTPLDPRLLASEGRFLVKSTDPVVVVAQDDTEAGALDTLLSDLPLNPKTIRIQCSGPALPGWTFLPDIFNNTSPDPDATPSSLTPSPTPASPTSTALIIFTSGTTNTPKGCLHTHRNLLAQIHTYDPNPDPSHIDRWLVHTPSSHIFAVNNALRAFHLGHAVLLPSKSFSIPSTLAALVHEQATIMSAVPTLLRALLSNPAFPGKEALNLSLVTLGGTVITQDDNRLCRDGLGAKDAIQGFGMSEGAPVVSWCRDDPALVGGYHPGVGKTLPGANMRVCVPGTREVVPRGVVGELHVGGEQIIQGYLGGVSGESFYTDGVGRWLVTGDQARMDEDGVVYILGRYKDVIIRGGENVSPGRLEAVIGEMEGVQGAQVVGVADELAGQVPVAVVKVAEGAAVSKGDIMAKCRGLGPMFALDGVYWLSELGMEVFPVTSLGKVKKELLRKKVAELREVKSMVAAQGSNVEGPKGHVSDAQPVPEETPNGHDNGLNGTKHTASVADQLAVIWEDLVGQKPGLDDNMASFADSITILRFCDRVLNGLNQRLYLQDFSENDTVNKQAALLGKRSKQSGGPPILVSSSFPSNGPALGLRAAQSRNQALLVYDVLNARTQGTLPKSEISNRHLPTLERPQVSTRSHSQASDSELHAAASQAALDAGLQLSDIEDILRIRENYHKLTIGPRPQSYHIRPVYRVGPSFRPLQIRWGIEAGLTARSILRTMIAKLPDGTPFHIVLHSSPLLFNALITTTQVASKEALTTLTRDGSSATHSSPFQSLFQIVTVRYPPETYLIPTYNHSIIDALSTIPWAQDLARLISNPLSLPSLPPLTPYKPFTDLLHLYGSDSLSLPARQSIAYTVSRLRGISRFRDALWPVRRAPGGFMIIDDGCPAHLADARNAVREQLWNNQWDTRYAKEFHSVPRVARNISLSGVHWLRREKGIEPMLVMKAAIAVLNVMVTGSRYAVFNTVLAGREWPFVPGWMREVLPPAMSIAGPTVEWALEMCEVPRGETVGGLLGRMKGEGEELERHCHAPWGRVLEGLGEGGEREVAEDAAGRQAFVWDVGIGIGMGGGGLDNDGIGPSRGGNEKVLELVARYDWPDCGLFWNAFMIDQTNLFFIASWDTAQMNLDEVEGHCNTMTSILRQLVKADNWDREIGHVFGTVSL